MTVEVPAIGARLNNTGEDRLSEKQIQSSKYRFMTEDELNTNHQ